MKKYIAYVLEETLPINESAKICTTPLKVPRYYRLLEENLIIQFLTKIAMDLVISPRIDEN